MSANECRFLFEDTAVGQLKERIYNMSDAEIENFMKECEVPSPGEMDKAGSYIQNTIRKEVIENRRKNDIVIIPVGCTENHGLHTVSAFDTLLVSRISEAVRRKQKKDKKPPVNLALPINYGVHPPWHQGMYGTVRPTIPLPAGSVRPVGMSSNPDDTGSGRRESLSITLPSAACSRGAERMRISGIQT